jgi:hypothetical protein
MDLRKRVGDHRLETAKRFALAKSLDEEEVDGFTKKRATAIEIKVCLSNIGKMEFFQFAVCMNTIATSEGLPDDLVEYSLMTMYTLKDLILKEIEQHNERPQVQKDLTMFAVVKSWAMAVNLFSHIDKEYKKFVISETDAVGDWAHMIFMNDLLNKLCKKVQTDMNHEPKWKEMAQEIRDVQQEEESWCLMFALRKFLSSYGQVAYNDLINTTSEAVRMLTAGPH